MHRTPRRMALLGVATVAALGVATGLSACTTSDDQGSNDPEPRRTEPCEDLDPGQLEAAMGGPTDVERSDRTTCVLRLEGSALEVTIDEVARRATSEDLAAVERTSGPSPDEQASWPEREASGVGDAARWFEDPATDGEYGELYVLESGRLVRITVATPLEYRRTAEAIGTQVGGVVLQDLAPTN